MDENNSDNYTRTYFGVEPSFDLKRWGLGGVIEFWDNGIAWWFQVGPICFQHTPEWTE